MARPGRGRDRVAVERARLLHELSGAVELVGEVAHDVPPAHHRGEGKATAHDLAERGQVRHHPVVLLGAAVGEAESGDDLVEHQWDVVPRGDRPYALEKARLRHDQALERLHDHRGEIMVVRLDHRLGLAAIVERGDQGSSPWIACGMPAESGVGAGNALGSRGPTLIRE